MRRDDLLKIFRQTNALLRGHFVLASGLHSGHYFQCALFLQHPRLASQVCAELASYFKKERVTTVVGLAVGGIVVSFEVARAMGIRSLYTERIDGKMQLRRGFGVGPKDRIIVVEDVITTGDSAQEVVQLLTKMGAKVVGVGAIVDRSGGRATFGKMPCRSIVSLRMENFPKRHCPLCKEGWPVTKPGTKGLKLML